jgi:hypothetical protein
MPIPPIAKARKETLNLQKDCIAVKNYDVVDVYCGGVRGPL